MQIIYEEIHNSIHKLESLLKNFRVVMASLTCHVSRVYALPPIQPDEQVAHTRPIIVNQLDDLQGFEAAMAAFTNLYAVDAHSTRFAHRLPGLICVSGSAAAKDELISNIQQINQQKEHIKATLLSIKNADKRYEIVHRLFPMIITLNIYRKIKFMDNPEHITFNWANKKSVVKTTRAKVLEKLTKQSRQKPSSLLTTADEWQLLIAKDIQDIQRLPEDCLLRYCRSLPMQPIVNINYKAIQFICALPLVAWHESGTFPKIINLASYLPKTQVRPASLTMLPVIERLNLYQRLQTK
jgi:DNA replication terminus site-binding protein